MAYTTIHAITQTLNKALDYIENPEKTDEQILVSAFNCDPFAATEEFRMTALLARASFGGHQHRLNDAMAYHMIQSFSPYDKITPEQAHKLGKEWADEILGGRYEYVISTHVDKGHIHNHVIFNATSYYDHRKFRSRPKKTAQQLREVSDCICRDNDLYVIQNPDFHRRQSHYEWEQAKAGTSWKAQIKSSIDAAIEKSSDWAGFVAALQEDGIEVLPGQRITFHKIGVESKNGRAGKCRGDRIGTDYTKERILERLQQPKDQKRDVPTPETYAGEIEWKSRKTRLAETKVLAEALLTIRKENISCDADFSVRQAEIEGKKEAVAGTIKTVDSKNLQYKRAAKYLLTLREFGDVWNQYEDLGTVSRKGQKFAALHEGELKAYAHAAAQLEKMGVKSNVDPDKVVVLVKEQDARSAELQQRHRDLCQRSDTLKRAQELVESIRRGDIAQEAEPVRSHQRPREEQER